MMGAGRYNYYEILELPSNAAQHEVTTAYERARDTYCGENPAIYTIFSEQEARDLLNIIEEAYAVLGNKTLRTIYDQRLFSQSPKSEELSYDAILMASKVMFPEQRIVEDKPVYEIDEAFEQEIAETTNWDGDMLRKVREYKKLSLEKMSSKTKINQFYLNAIEGMDPSGLPAPVFVRGYVVQMAKLLGLNDRSVADSFMTLYKRKIGQ